MNRRRFLLLGPALALAACARPPAPEDEIFGLTLPDLTGKEQSLANRRGHPLLINFWATWCRPCREEMPLLAELSARYPQVQFLGIGIDQADAIRRWQNEHPVPYPLLVAPSSLLDRTAELGNRTLAVPFTLVLNADGHTAFTHTGAVPRAALEAVLAQLT